MAERRIEARVIRTCDRCRVELTPENTRENREYMTKMTSHRFLRKGVVSRVLGQRPRAIMAEIHFCDGCWWEFDMLFCQGLGVRPIASVRQYEPSPQHGREALAPSLPESGETT